MKTEPAKLVKDSFLSRTIGYDRLAILSGRHLNRPSFILSSIEASPQNIKGSHTSKPRVSLQGKALSTEQN